MPKKQNAPDLKNQAESATDTRNFTGLPAPDKSEKVRDSDKPAKPLKFTPRELRIIEAMQRKEWTPREEIDRIAGASNGPAVIAGIRAKLGGKDTVEMHRMDATDRDGKPCKQWRCTMRKALRLLMATAAAPDSVAQVICIALLVLLSFSTNAATHANAMRTHSERNASRPAELPTKAANPATLTPKPKGPVPEKHQRIRGCDPHLKAGFCHAQILWCRTLRPPHGYGRDGHIRKDCRTAYPVFFTSRPPAAMKTQTVAYPPRYGANAMTDKAITNSDALQHLNSAKAKLQKAVAALGTEVTTTQQLHAALGNVLSAGRSLKRAAEAEKHCEEKREG